MWPVSPWWRPPGFSDVIEIARQDRPSLYDPWADRPDPLVGRADRLEVSERLAADGSVLGPYRPGSVPRPADGVARWPCASCTADVDPRHEARSRPTWRRRVGTCASHRVSPEFREYERMATTVVNAALRPVCAAYLAGLADLAPDVVVMTSGGGLVDLRTAADVPASLLLSGPAAGVRAAAGVARPAGSRTRSASTWAAPAPTCA